MTRVGSEHLEIDGINVLCISNQAQADRIVEFGYIDDLVGMLLKGLLIAFLLIVSCRIVRTSVTGGWAHLQLSARYLLIKDPLRHFSLSIVRIVRTGKFRKYFRPLRFELARITMSREVSLKGPPEALQDCQFFRSDF